MLKPKDVMRISAASKLNLRTTWAVLRAIGLAAPKKQPPARERKVSRR